MKIDLKKADALSREAAPFVIIFASSLIGGQLFNRKNCSDGSKFFPLKVDPNPKTHKEITSQTDKYLVILTSKDIRF